MEKALRYYNGNKGVIDLADVAINELPRQSNVQSSGDVLVLDTGSVTYAITVLNFITNYLAQALSIPTKTSDLQNDSGFLTSHQTVDNALSQSSQNPVQNRIITAALNDAINSIPTVVTNTLGANVLRNVSFAVANGVMTVTKTFYNNSTATQTVTLFEDGDEIPV